MTLRPFEERDYPRLVQIRNALFPDYLSNEAECATRTPAGSTDRYFRPRLVPRTARAVVAMGELGTCRTSSTRTSTSSSVAVDPAAPAPGHRQRRCTTHSRETPAPARALLVRGDAKESHARERAPSCSTAGFGEVQRFWESRLDVRRASIQPPFAGAEARVAGAGITITTLEEEMARRDGGRRAAGRLRARPGRLAGHAR